MSESTYSRCNAMPVTINWSHHQDVSDAMRSFGKREGLAVWLERPSCTGMHSYLHPYPKASKPTQMQLADIDDRMCHYTLATLNLMVQSEVLNVDCL